MTLHRLGQDDKGNTKITESISTNDDKRVIDPPTQTGEVKEGASPVKTNIPEIDNNDNAIEMLNDMVGADEKYVPQPLHSEEEERENNQVGMQVHDPEFYEKQQQFVGGHEVIDTRDRTTKRVNRDAIWRESTDKEKATVLNRELAKPATQQDLTRLDESMIMSLPQIKAASYELQGYLHPKFKDKTLRGRFANFKNYVEGNLHRFLAIGFQIASVEDIDQESTPVPSSMIDGTTIKYHDVILLKINVIRLMELYKAGILKSQDRLAHARQKGIAEANRQFQQDLSTVDGQGKAYYKDYLQTHEGKPPVTFEMANQ